MQRYKHFTDISITTYYNSRDLYNSWDNQDNRVINYDDSAEFVTENFLPLYESLSKLQVPVSNDITILVFDRDRELSIFCFCSQRSFNDFSDFMEDYNKIIELTKNGISLWAYEEDSVNDEEVIRVSYGEEVDDDDGSDYFEIPQFKTIEIEEYFSDMEKGEGFNEIKDRKKFDKQCFVTTVKKMDKLLSYKKNYYFLNLDDKIPIDFPISTLKLSKAGIRKFKEKSIPDSLLKDGAEIVNQVENLLFGSKSYDYFGYNRDEEFVNSRLRNKFLNFFKDNEVVMTMTRFRKNHKEL